MINVTVGTTTSKAVKMYEGSTTIRFILEDNAIDYSMTSVLLDGINLKSDEMDKTLTQLNKTTKCMLIAAVKAEAAY